MSYQDAALIDAVQRLGRHWKDIQRELFPGRSKNDIKNRYALRLWHYCFQLTESSYTVLVRKYQNQGVPLPNAPSSPSDCGTPALSSYPEDDDYLSGNAGIYDDLLQAPSHTAHRNSWSSFDNDAYSTWSSPQDYGLPPAIASPSAHHIPQYAYTQPPQVNSNVPSTWDQTTPYIQHTSSLHTSAPTNPSAYGYSTYPVAQQPMIPVYSASTARAQYATMPPTTSGQQAYDPNAPAMYPDPRHQPRPYYYP
jgi:hypothetical protein